MLLENKNAVIYGGGSVGSAVARAFAREGARVSSPVEPSRASRRWPSRSAPMVEWLTQPNSMP